MSLTKVRFENSAPIFCVADLTASVRYYVEALGFQNAPWGTDDFTCVSRDAAAIYLCLRGQGNSGTWAWVGVEDVSALYEELHAQGAKIRHAPRNYPWALEMHVEDLDGHILRFGSEPRQDRPFDHWIA
jgi:predicted lactoylglutathione lyase